MTRREALKEARAYFGPSVTTQENKAPNYAGRKQNRCYIMKRTVVKTVKLDYIGMGPTWEAALADAYKGSFKH